MPRISELFMRGLLASLLTLGLWAAPVTAGGVPAPGKLVLDQWDAAYLQGGRAGHVRTYTTEVEQDGEKRLRTTVELRLTVKRFSDTISLAMDTGTVETPEGKVTGVFMRQFLGKDKELKLVVTV